MKAPVSQCTPSRDVYLQNATFPSARGRSAGVIFHQQSRIKKLQLDALLSNCFISVAQLKWHALDSWVKQESLYSLINSARRVHSSHMEHGPYKDNAGTAVELLYPAAGARTYPDARLTASLVHPPRLSFPHFTLGCGTWLIADWSTRRRQRISPSAVLARAVNQFSRGVVLIKTGCGNLNFGYTCGKDWLRIF